MISGDAFFVFKKCLFYRLLDSCKNETSSIYSLLKGYSSKTIMYASIPRAQISTALVGLELKDSGDK